MLTKTSGKTIILPRGEAQGAAVEIFPCSTQQLCRKVVQHHLLSWLALVVLLVVHSHYYSAALGSHLARGVLTWHLLLSVGSAFVWHLDDHYILPTSHLWKRDTGW